MEVERITSNIVDGSINQIIEDNIDEELFTIRKDKDDNIESLDYKTKEVNKILKLISNDIQRKLILLEDGKLDEFQLSDTFRGKRFKYIKNGIVCEIPMSSLSGNGFITNLGPVIPIKMSFLGQVSSNLKTKVTNYGINNLYLEINIEVEVKEKITMPKLSKASTIKITSPLTIKIIEGKIPEYYGGSINKYSSLFKT